MVLEHVRVLDLADGGAMLAGQLLADLGADVVLVEPLDGASIRRDGPFADDIDDPNRSLPFWSLNRGKRSCVLDLEVHGDRGREHLRRLAASADVLLDSHGPGWLEDLSLGAGDLATLNPSLVVVSMTPFGLTGPKATWPAHSLTVEASSGAMSLCGDADRAPCQASVFPQAMLHAGLEGAVAAMIAYFGRAVAGGGQHVDVSGQTAMMLTAQQATLSPPWNDQPVHRSGGGIMQAGIRFRFIYPASDGFVSITVIFGGTFGRFVGRMADVMLEEGFIDEGLHGKDWTTYNVALTEGTEPVSELERLTDSIEQWTSSHTKSELFEIAKERGLLLVPVSMVDDLLMSEQLQARDYWRSIDHPELGRPVTYAGPSARLSATPIVYKRPPPLVGEHTAEILEEESLQERERAAMSALPMALAAPATRPLTGLKVLDFTWVLAGPAAVRYLTDFGADVVGIESSLHPDSLRNITPFLDGKIGPHRSGIHTNMNCDKRSLSLDLRQPESLGVIHDLVRWADVVVENFSPKAMPALGLDYESLRRVKPDLIMLSSCLNGQDGPGRLLAGYGTMGAQMAGFGALAGWADRAPAGPFGAYTDYVSPRYAAVSLLAALEHRRHTGEGQYIDLSQVESSIHLLGPMLLDFTVNGRIARRMGNASPWAAPHGVYRCAGDDRWVAIVASNLDEWQALCRAIDRPDWLADPDLGERSGRVARGDLLDEGIGEWTADKAVESVEARLIAEGVPCHRISRGVDVIADPQLAARRHFVRATHPELGEVTVESSRLVMSRTPGSPRRAGRTYGEHNEEILAGSLGYSSDRIRELVACGALR